MKNIISAWKHAPRRFASMAVVTAAVLIPAGLFAWGPERPTYTIEQPADHVTFNSMTNTPNVGDERNFVRIREAGNGNYSDEVQIQPGKEYEVYVYYHNNASSTLNDEAHDKKGVAHGSTMRVQMPATVNAGDKARITGFVSATNAQPSQVWDEAYAASDSAVALRYVPGSATIHSNGAVGGSQLPDNLFTTGAALGYDSLNGELPGCYEYAGYVIFKFKADQPNFEISKQVAKEGEQSYQESVSTTADGTVNYKIKYKNTGTTQQDNVVVKDTLPEGMTYVPGSTYVSNAGTNNQWAPAGNDDIVGNGINFGSFAPGAAVYVKFSAKVNAEELECGANTIKNVAEAITENGGKSDDADVIVNKDCQDTTPSYTCDAIGIIKTSNTKYSFNTGYTLKNSTFKSVEYVIRNSDGEEVARVDGAPNLANYEQTTPGTYSVQAVLTVTVNGSDKEVTSEDCKKEFTVQAPSSNPIEVCDLTTNEVITIEEDEFDETKHSLDIEDCNKSEPISVCDITTDTIVVIEKDELDESKHSQNLDDCKDEEPIEVCDTVTGNVITIDKDAYNSDTMSKDTSDCDEPTPTTVVVAPSELPQTGAGVGVVVSAGTLIASLGYYIASRRGLGL